MIFVFRTRAWGLGAWEGGPLGPWGASQGLPGGGPGPTSADRWSSCPPWIRIKNHVDFDVDFWSFWGRSWVPLGVMLGSCWRLFRPKLVSEPSSNRLIFEKVIVHETLCFPMVFAQIDPKMGPRSTQDRSKTGPRSSWIAFLASSIFASIFDRFGIGFGAVLGAKMMPN